MKFKLELAINKSVTDVWKVFDNTENRKIRQPSLKKFKHVSGTPGQPGAVSTLTYEEDGREFVLTERITLREESNRFDAAYENEFTKNTIKNTFTEQGDTETLWIIETKYTFKTTAMKIIGPLRKKNFIARTQRDMERLKDLVESSDKL